MLCQSSNVPMHLFVLQLLCVLFLRGNSLSEEIPKVWPQKTISVCPAIVVIFGRTNSHDFYSARLQRSEINWSHKYAVYVGAPQSQGIGTRMRHGVNKQLRSCVTHLDSRLTVLAGSHRTNQSIHGRAINGIVDAHIFSTLAVWITWNRTRCSMYIHMITYVYFCSCLCVCMYSVFTHSIESLTRLMARFAEP